MNKYDTFLLDLANGKALQSAIKEIYEIEFNEQFENILLKKEADFMRYLSLRSKFQIEERYSNESFENIKLVACIKECEKELYENEYKTSVSILRSHLNAIDDNNNETNPPQSSLVFRKHCKYQNNTLTHSCEEDNTIITILNRDNAKQIDYLLCKKCLTAYKASFVKLYCNFCYLSYYSLIENDQSEIGYEIQPVTWEKYHCDLLINEQMRCLNCKADLYLHIIKNQLMCLACNFASDPLEIGWKCVQCLKEFTSNAKIFNPNEYKTMTLTIKDSMFNKKYAMPPSIPCGHSCEFFRHKKECNGKLYLSEVSERKMVMCSKCNEMTKYDKYIWTCPICFARFRNDTKIVIKIPNSEIIKKVQFSYQGSITIPKKGVKKSLNRSCFDIIPKGFNTAEELAKSNKNIEPEDKDKDEDEDEVSKTNKNKEAFDFRKLHSKSRDEELLLSNNKVKLPLVDISTYEIVSQISTSQRSKVFAVKSNAEKEYKALKRHSYSNEAKMNESIQQYALHYSFQPHKGIVSIQSLHIDYAKMEISVLEELGIGDWESEMAAMRKMNQDYIEMQILSILNQLTDALEYLQENDYVHWYINPKNVIIFKDSVFKMTDLVYLKEATSINIFQNDNIFISPNLIKIFKEKKVKTVNMVKSDVYSLGLCVIEAITLNNPLEIFVEFVNIDLSEDSDIIMKRFEKKLKEKINPKLISNNFISLVLKMIEIDEKERVDFKELKEILSIYN